MRACHDRMDRQHDANAWLAWTTARLLYQKDAKFSDLLSGGKPKEKIQTLDQQQAAIEALFLGFGGSRAQLDAVRAKHEGSE